MRKSLLSAFTRTQNAPVKLRRRYQMNVIKVIFEDIASKLEKIGPIISSFNPFPSLLSVATDGRKQFANPNANVNVETSFRTTTVQVLLF